MPKHRAAPPRPSVVVRDPGGATRCQARSQRISNAIGACVNRKFVSRNRRVNLGVRILSTRFSGRCVPVLRFRTSGPYRGPEQQRPRRSFTTTRPIIPYSKEGCQAAGEGCPRLSGVPNFPNSESVTLENIMHFRGAHILAEQHWAPILLFQWFAFT